MRPEDGGEAPQQDALGEGEEGAELFAGRRVAIVAPVLGVAEIHEEHEEEELAGRHDAAHEESDGDAGVKSPHDHGAADAKADDDYGRPRGREGFSGGSGRYRPERHDGDEEGKGQDGVPVGGREWTQKEMVRGSCEKYRQELCVCVKDTRKLGQFSQIKHQWRRIVLIKPNSHPFPFSTASIGATFSPDHSAL